MKNLKNIKINVGIFEVEEIKEILWELCYNAENAMQELDIKVENPKDLINLILEECKNSAKELNFAGETPCRYTYGIDLGINNSVVRDVILERCYLAYEKEASLENSPENTIEKITKLFKTQENGDRDNYEKRVFGGLRAIGFSYQEAQYLKDTCNLYPYGLFLERMLLQNPIEEPNFGEEICSTPAKEVIPTATATQAKTVLPTVLLENKSEVEDLYSKLEDIGNISSYDDLAKEFAAVQSEMEKLRKKITKISELKDMANDLQNKGIPFDYLLDNNSKVISLFEAVANL